ncbi:MAG: response regulator [Deltaproteobacteria bacterium]|jgi:excisionase family DNA binding protein|nr:response regulator [Deltaproteobacteria bacterium]
MNQEVFTVPQAAKYCAIGRVTLWKYVKSGELKASLTPGGHYRILKKDLEAFARQKGMYPLANYKPPGKRILIVDDDPAIREIIEKTLSAYQYETETAAEGFEAGVKVPTFQPNLIILDIHMSGKDGFEVCRQIKQNPATAHIKILIITGYDSEENQNRTISEGADGYLAKPFEKDTLLRHVKNLLS